MKPDKQLYQWDTNQSLVELTPSAKYVDYPIGDEVIRLETAGTRCRIPDEVLQTYGGKTCYERYPDGTYRAYSFTVLYAPKPPEYVYTPEERTTFEALTARVDAALQTEVDRLRGECDTLAAENRKQENRISALMKLNKGQTYDILPEEGETASRTAPSGAKYVSVDKVEGKSIVWNQLLDYTKAPKTTTDNGIMCTNNMDGTFTATGTAGDSRYSYIDIPVNVVAKHTYLSLSTQPGSVGKSYLTGEAIGTNAYDRGNGAIASAKTTGVAYLVVQYYEAGQTVAGEIAKPQLYDLTQMFGAGNEPTIEQFKKLFTQKIYPYNPGEIISSTTASIDLTPGNIYPGTVPVKYFPCKIKKGETFTASAKCKINEVKCRYATEDNSQKDYYTLSDLVGTYADEKTRYKRKIRASFDIAFVMFDVAEGKTASDFVVEMGDGDGTYKKYFEPSQFPTGFPELRSAGTAHDEIDMDSGAIRRNVGTVDLGSLSWSYSDKYEWWESNSMIGQIAAPAASSLAANAICNRFLIVKQDDNYINPGVSVWTSGQISVKSDEIKSAEDLSGVTFYYEKATPTTEQVAIPEALQEWLPVEPGGTVTFRNADESKQLAVSNSVSWVRKLNEVE